MKRKIKKRAPAFPGCEEEYLRIVEVWRGVLGLPSDFLIHPM